jgi:hypothetical protein
MILALLLHFVIGFKLYAEESMRAMSFLVLATSVIACSTTKQAEIKESVATAKERTKQAGAATAEGVKDVWSNGKEAVSTAYNAATTVPPEERQKKAFEAEKSARLASLDQEAEGLKLQAKAFDVADKPAFKAAMEHFDEQHLAADQALASVRTETVVDWQKRKKPLEEAFARLDQSAVHLREVVRAAAH